MEEQKKGKAGFHGSSFKKPCFKFVLGLIIGIIALVMLELITRGIGILTHKDFRTNPLPAQRPIDVICSKDGESLYLCPESGNSYERIRYCEFKKNPLKNRIVVVGESFVFGTGLEMEKTWVSMLQKRLGDKAEVLNFGRCGTYTSILTQVVDAALKINTSLIIIAAGNNEHTMTTYYSGWLGKYSPIIYRSSEIFCNFYLYGSFYNFFEKNGLVPGFKDNMNRSFKDPVDKIVYSLRRRPVDLSLIQDKLVGIEPSKRIETIKSIERRMFQAYLRKMVEASTKKGVKILFLTLPRELTSLPRLSGIFEGNETKIRNYMKEMIRNRFIVIDEKLLHDALKESEKVAHFQFAYGRYLLNQGKIKEAINVLRLAAELDLAPDVTPKINDIIRNVANDYNCPLVDLGMIGERYVLSPDDFFIDNIHVNEKGAIKVGELVAAAVNELD